MTRRPPRSTRTDTLFPYTTLFRSLDHRRDIRADLLGDQPVILGVVHIMEDLGRAQQRLGGDAPPVEADAAQILTLDDRGLQAELRRADRRDIAAGARRSEERRVGKECVSTGRSRGAPEN